MHFKLIITIVDDVLVDRVVDAARKAGATGSTVLRSARGEGMEPKRSFLGMDLVSAREVVLLLVEQHLARHILERIGQAGGFDESSGTGTAFQIDVEDAVGVVHQIASLQPLIEEDL